MTERTKPKRSKLVKLKKWLTISEAARYLAVACGDDATESDIYQLALDGELKLSVRFVNSVPATRKDPEPTEAEEDLVWLEDVWDLPISGAERREVEQAYQLSTEGPEVDMTRYFFDGRAGGVPRRGGLPNGRHHQLSGGGHSRGERRTSGPSSCVAETQSVFCVAARRDGAGVRQTDHRRAGRQKTGWTKPQRYPSMGIRSLEACREPASWHGGGP